MPRENTSLMEKLISSSHSLVLKNKIIIFHSIAGAIIFYLRRYEKQFNSFSKTKIKGQSR